MITGCNHTTEKICTQCKNKNTFSVSIFSSEEIAFVQGAKWWEFKSTGGTMWNSDRREAEREAVERKKKGILGKPKF